MITVTHVLNYSAIRVLSVKTLSGGRRIPAGRLGLKHPLALAVCAEHGAALSLHLHPLDRRYLTCPGQIPRKSLKLLADSHACRFTLELHGSTQNWPVLCQSVILCLIIFMTSCMVMPLVSVMMVSLGKAMPMMSPLASAQFGSTSHPKRQAV